MEVTDLHLLRLRPLLQRVDLRPQYFEVRPQVMREGFLILKSSLERCDLPAFLVVYRV